MKSILVIGESCIDEFHYGSVRVNPEAPTLSFKPNGRVLKNKGMSGNVARNLQALCSEYKIHLYSSGEAEIKKIRYVEDKSDYILFRLDLDGNINGFNYDHFHKKNLEFGNPDGIVISDYNKGFLSEEDIYKIAQWARANNIPLFVDTKKKLSFQTAVQIFCIKINEHEFQNNREISCSENFVLTKGERGADLYKNGGLVANYPAIVVEIACLSGAGDSFQAGLVAEYLRSKSLTRAVKYANVVAGIAVSYHGVGAISKEEVDGYIRNNGIQIS